MVTTTVIVSTLCPLFLPIPQNSVPILWCTSVSYVPLVISKSPSWVHHSSFQLHFIIYCLAVLFITYCVMEGVQGLPTVIANCASFSLRAKIIPFGFSQAQRFAWLFVQSRDSITISRIELYWTALMRLLI